MVDIVLFAGKLLLLALLYLFLFAAVRAGIGRVSSAVPVDDTWRLGLAVEQGPPELKGIKLDLADTVIIGRLPDSDLVIADDFVSSHHARIEPTARGPEVVDLGSTNGTRVNGRRLGRPVVLGLGDVVDVGRVRLKVEPL